MSSGWVFLTKDNFWASNYFYNIPPPDLARAVTNHKDRLFTNICLLICVCLHTWLWCSRVFKYIVKIIILRSPVGWMNWRFNCFLTPPRRGGGIWAVENVFDRGDFWKYTQSDVVVPERNLFWAKIAKFWTKKDQKSKTREGE